MLYAFGVQSDGGCAQAGVQTHTQIARNIAFFTAYFVAVCEPPVNTSELRSRARLPGTLGATKSISITMSRFPTKEKRASQGPVAYLRGPGSQSTRRKVCR